MDALLPTTKHRRGRRTARQQAALDAPPPYLLTSSEADLAPVFDRGGPVILDVGFGTGEAVIAYAIADPATRILAVDMHTPGIGDLLASIGELGLPNVYVVEADVRVVLAHVPTGALAGARTFFPDPWPKKRHHRRRLIQPDFIACLADRVAPGGAWHIVTDWTDYAEHIASEVSACSRWSGGVIERPLDRPITRFERRGIAAGRAPIDLLYARVAS